jgi:flagellar hook-associated protein 1
MSLNGALQIGKSALVASQAAIQVAGNNMANAATPGYHRQVVSLSPSRSEQIGRGQFVGQGVLIKSIGRAVDTALQARVRDAISDENRASIDQRFLGAIETIQNELTDNDLSSLLSRFFNSFSELANNPQENAVRSVVIQEGASLAGRIATLREDYNGVRDEIDRALDAAVTKVDGLLDQIATLNTQIAQTEQGVGVASSLRDQRDLIIDEVSQFLDVSVVEQPNGAMDVLVGSIPIVLAGESRGLDLRLESDGDALTVSVRVEADGSILNISSGSIGALLDQRATTVEPAIESLDTFAQELIYQVNRIHSQGQGKVGHTALTGTYGTTDPTADLNTTDAGLPYSVGNGSFLLHVTNAQTGARETFQIAADGDNDSLNDIISRINTASGGSVTAGLSLESGLTLTAAAGYEISFSDDSSGVLAALGVNTFFDGFNAATIAVNETLESSPDLLAVAAGHVSGSNTTAINIAQLQDTNFAALGGRTLREYWQSEVNSLAVRADAANSAAESSRIVRQSLEAQAQAVSGVSIDEEAISLLTFQRQFQAAARFISVIDETLQTLLSIV